MKKMRKILLFVGLLLIFLLFPVHVFAESIHSFDVNIVAGKTGEMNVTEVINYDFGDLEKHGIYRDIPLYSSVGNLYRVIKIENILVLRDLQTEQFSLSNDSKNLNIKIGNPNKTITGSHIYTISYRVLNGIGSNFQDHDEIYWNATGNSWVVDIEKASAKVETDFGPKSTDFICFTGPIGSTDKSCKVNGGSAVTSQTLNPSYGLTVVAVFPAGTFPKSILSKEAPRPISEDILLFILKNYLYILIFLNILVPLYLVFWYQKHKNKKRFGPPAVNFDIPKDEKGNTIRPALAGTIDTAKLERDDVVATIFDLAIRKYIKLEEKTNKSKVLGVFDTTNKEQIITKLKAGKDLENFEKTLYDYLFEFVDSVNLSDLKSSFYITFQSMEKGVFSNLISRGYYTKNPKIQKGIFIFLSVLSFVTLNLILGFVLLFFAIKLNGRTALGDEIDYKIDGLKLFLKSMDRNYKWQAEKFYIVEQMIPYAIALGYIDEFMKQLKLIKPDYNPTWYSGYAAGGFYLSYSGFYSSMSSTIAPSSSSGAGGGGFSGGGGGGGGGGSW